MADGKSAADGFTGDRPARLDIKGLTWGAIPGQPIIGPRSLSVEPGEMLALVGPNGAGKSSLLRCLYRYHRPSSGLVLLDGDDIWTLSGKSVARRVATVLQEQASDFGLSVPEIVELGLTPHRVLAIALAATATSTALAAGYPVTVQSCNRGVTFEASPQRAVGGDYRRVLPLSALVGAIFLVLAAIVTRILIPPQDMPIGVLTGIIGGLFFIGLMRWRQTGAE